MRGRHVDLAWLLEHGAEPGLMNDDEWLALATHLSRGCRRCWTAVGRLPAAAVPRSADPLLEALYHLRAPGSWLVLSSDHLAALTTARERPFGFAFVVLEEAIEIAVDAEPVDLDVLLRPLRLVGDLESRRQRRRYHDLAARTSAYLALAHAWRGNPHAALDAQRHAVSSRLEGSGDVSILVTLLEVYGALCGAFGMNRRAEEYFRRALRFLGDGDCAVRRFELWGEIAELRAGMGQTARLPRLVAHASTALEPLRRSDDPFRRLRAAYKHGRLVGQLAQSVDPGHTLRTTEARRAADALARETEHMAMHADASAWALWLLCQARLYACFDLDRAAATYDAAATAIDEAGGGCLLEKTLFELAVVEAKRLPRSGRQGARLLFTYPSGALDRTQETVH